MLNFGIKYKPETLFQGIKDPKSFEELQSIVKSFLDKEEEFSHKKMSRERIRNLEQLFKGLDTFKKSILLKKSQYSGNTVRYNSTTFGILPKAEIEEDLEFIDKNLELLDEELQKIVGLRSVLKNMQDMTQQLNDLLKVVIDNSQRFIVVKALNSATGRATAAIMEVNNFLRRNHLSASDFDQVDIDRLRKYKIEI